MKLKINIFSINFGLIILFQLGFGKRQTKLETIVQTHSIDLCSMNDQLPMKYSYVSLVNQGKGVVGYEAKLVVDRNLTPSTAQLKVERCTGPDLSSCEHYLKVNDIDVCHGVMSKMIEKAFYSLFDPNLSCPIKKGMYNFILLNSGIKTFSEMLSKFVVLDPKYYWKINLKIFDEDKKTLAYCIKTTLRAVERRIVESKDKNGK